MSKTKSTKVETDSMYIIYINRYVMSIKKGLHLSMICSFKMHACKQNRIQLCILDIQNAYSHAPARISPRCSPEYEYFRIFADSHCIVVCKYVEFFNILYLIVCGWPYTINRSLYAFKKVVLLFPQKWISM